MLPYKKHGKSVSVPMVPECAKASFVVCYTLNQSIEIAVLPSVYNPTHDENIKTTNTVMCEIP